jgi:formylglycine-generating enzyme required for sulfatase activity
MRPRVFRRSIFVSAFIVSTLLLSFHSSLVSIEGTASTQDPNATLPSTKKTAPAKKKGTLRKRTNSGNAAADEIAFWASIKDSTDPDDFNAYLKQYPKGKFATLAKNRLRTLEGASSSTTPNSNLSSLNMPRMRTNQAGIEFMLIPPGSFMMGSTNGGDDEKPVHQVTIKYSYYIGRFEVTQAQWQSVMGNNPSSFKGDLADPYIKLPVESVSWDDTQNFINKLNEGNDGFRYRLPTEAEWEYACRAGTTGAYAGNLSQMAWFAENSENRTHTVGQKQPNAWGLFDMHGNVWEWCQDWYDAYPTGPVTDPQGASSGSGRVFRGGNWYSYGRYCRSAFRSSAPTAASYAFGFRVVLAPSQ